MKVIVVENYDEMSAKATEYFAEAISKKPDLVIGLATGSTPVGMYTRLGELCAEGKLDFSKVRSVNLDEYYPIDPANEQSYRYFMNEKLFSKTNIDMNNTFVPDGSAEDVDAFCRGYEDRIDAMGGIDIQVLGIGRNGHIGFNEPDSELVAITHKTPITQSTIEANARFFDSIDEVPKHAITMGIQTIFKARKIVMMISGADKAEALKVMLSGKITTACPASLLCLHPDVTVICDKAAYEA